MSQPTTEKIHSVLTKYRRSRYAAKLVKLQQQQAVLRKLRYLEERMRNRMRRIEEQASRRELLAQADSW